MVSLNDLDRDWDNDKGVKCMERIRSFTLDHLLFHAADVKLTQRPLLLKMDIEGSETKALRGAKHLLSSQFSPCFIFFEHQRVPTETTGVSHREMFDGESEGTTDTQDLCAAVCDGHNVLALVSSTCSDCFLSSLPTVDHRPLCFDEFLSRESCIGYCDATLLRQN